MRDVVPKIAHLPGVMVPVSLLMDPDGFGGQVLGDCLAGDLVIRDGRAAGLEVGGTQPTRLVLPRFTEPHVHLDKCHTIDRMQGVGGGLNEAIKAQARDRATWTEADIRVRAQRGLQELVDAGCSAIRTHVDWGTAADPSATPLAWDIVGELAEDLTGDIILQRAALTDAARMVEDDYAELCALQVSRADAVLGAFVLNQPNRQDGILSTFRIADKIGAALDFHVDEGLELGLNGLEMIADAALEVGFEGPVLCGHACSLMNFGTADVQRIADKLARAGISVAALPATNLYLQGRNTGTPDRRGITRIRELQDAGVNVVLGADNVGDAFCPLGSHNPLATLSLAALAAHLDPPFGRHLPMITTGARRALGLAPETVDGAATGDLQLFDAQSVTAILGTGRAPRPLVEALQGGQQ